MTVVYALREENGIVKIGMSDNLPWRIETLQRGRNPLTLLGKVELADRKEARAVERTAHYLLRQMRESGEWFDVTDEQVESAINDALKHIYDGNEPPSEGGPNPPVVVRIPPTLLARLDAYRVGKTRPQAIRELLEEYLS